MGEWGDVCVCIDCTRKWIGNAVQKFSSSSVRSHDIIARVRHVPLPAGQGFELQSSCPLAHKHYSPCGKCS